MLDPIFSDDTPKNEDTSQQTANKQPSQSPPTSQKQKNVVKKRSSDYGTPSISRALNGKAKDEKSNVQKPEEEHKTVKQTADKPFSVNDIEKIWPQFISRFEDQPHLYKTLETTPKLNGQLVVIEVENSVQQEKIRSLKPSIIGFLSRNLQNNKIDVEVILNKKLNENKALTEEQKLKMMIKKNPNLMLFKNKFNLDFN